MALAGADAEHDNAEVALSAKAGIQLFHAKTRRRKEATKIGRGRFVSCIFLRAFVRESTAEPPRGSK
jgi:hypothetical protein